MTGDRLTVEDIRRAVQAMHDAEMPDAGPIFLHPAEWDYFEGLGYDMRGYRKIGPIPTEGLTNGRAR